MRFSFPIQNPTSSHFISPLPFYIFLLPRLVIRTPLLLHHSVCSSASHEMGFTSMASLFLKQVQCRLFHRLTRLLRITVCLQHPTAATLFLNSRRIRLERRRYRRQARERLSKFRSGARRELVNSFLQKQNLTTRCQRKPVEEEQPRTN